ncbi:MAG: hypothetical protein E7317_06875 [Clostridiales bacterium]|nr:hypothetical protein [Clostridiales bacterium]
MKSGNRSNALLVELLIVIMFFMLAAAVLVRVFFAAHRQTEKADMENRALNDAQCIADRLYCADDAFAALEAYGFVQAGDAWTLERDDYMLSVKADLEEMTQGSMLRRQVTVVSKDDEVLLDLPVYRYEEGHP